MKMNEYIAITKDAIFENTKIEFGLYLRSGSHKNYKYVLFSRGNEQFSPERKGKILNTEQKYTKTLYFYRRH